MPITYDLPWNTAERYWLVLWADAPFSKSFRKALTAIETHQEHGATLYFPLSKYWNDEWQMINQIVRELGPAVGLHSALVPGANLPNKTSIERYMMPVSSIDRIAHNLWLGEALLDDRLHCFLQPVIDRRDHLFAYEAFARVYDEQERIIDGATIFQASKGLGAEEVLDQHLHMRAVHTFQQASLDGYLFINMLPGIVHKPEKYLYALGHSIASTGIDPSRIVLDIGCHNIAYTPRQIQVIHTHAHEKGYATALDDIMTLESAIDSMRFVIPAFLKLDIRLVHRIGEASAETEIAEIVKLAHGANVAVMGEGVETQDQYDTLYSLGVDYFQGYLIGRPEPIDEDSPLLHTG